MPREWNKTLPILITGAKGFIGKNLTAELAAKGFADLRLFDLDTPKELLELWTKDCAFVFHFAGVNRPQDPREFYEGNSGFTEHLIALLEKAGNRCPVLATSSTQAALDNPYGDSKRQAEQLLLTHSEKTGAPLHLYRLPGVFGKWSRPSYNSVVATFCHQAAHGQTISVHDPASPVSLVYIDDALASFLLALEDGEPKENGYSAVQPVHETTVGFLADTIGAFPTLQQNLEVPALCNPLVSKLYSTYLSYLPKDKFLYPLTTHADHRGSFTEFLRTPCAGQVSVNVAKPGIAKGNHWHHSKNEKFLVVAGRARIAFRKIGEEEVFSFDVTGEKLQVVEIPTGYTHSIENTGDSDLVTLMWASEAFDKERPDTFLEAVEKE